MNQTIERATRKKDPFARIPHELLEDESISWQAKGILCYLVGKPPGWKVRVADLENRGTAGKTAIRAALKELRSVGYVKLECVREGGKVVEWKWHISEERVFSPDAGFPHLVNRHCSKKKGIVRSTSKESEETPSSIEADAPREIAAQWKPDGRTKEQKLRSIRIPENYPFEREYDAFIDTADLGQILNYKPDLYSKLCNEKWHQWDERLKKWKPIRDWKKYVAKLNEKIER